MLYLAPILFLLCEWVKPPTGTIPNYSWSREKPNIPANFICSCCRGKLHPQTGRIPLSGSNLTPIQPLKKKREIE
jgi:hypothetical protein